MNDLTPSQKGAVAEAAITAAAEFDLYIDLHLGRHDYILYASDLTEDYVAFNKGDVRNPASLGG